MPKEEDKILLCLELQGKFMTFNVDEKNFVELYSIDATKYQDDTITLSVTNRMLSTISK